MPPNIHSRNQTSSIRRSIQCSRVIHSDAVEEYGSSIEQLPSPSSLSTEIIVRFFAARSWFSHALRSRESVAATTDLRTLFLHAAEKHRDPTRIVKKEDCSNSVLLQSTESESNYQCAFAAAAAIVVSDAKAAHAERNQTHQKL